MKPKYWHFKLPRGEMEGEGGEWKTSSFSSDYYIKRSAFLKTYQLQCREEDDEEEKEEEEKKMEEEKRGVQVSLKRRLVSVFELVDCKFVVLKKIRDKVGLYAVSCNPLGFKKKTL